MQAVRFVVRRLGQRPGFTAVAVGTLALAIGANAAIFSLVEAVLLRPLAFRTRSRSFRSAVSTRSESVASTSPMGSFRHWG
jgi:hypothetical protein